MFKCQHTQPKNMTILSGSPKCEQHNKKCPELLITYTKIIMRITRTCDLYKYSQFLWPLRQHGIETNSSNYLYLLIENFYLHSKIELVDCTLNVTNSNRIINPWSSLTNTERSSTRLQTNKQINVFCFHIAALEINKINLTKFKKKG